MVNDVCSCGEVSMMSGGVMGSSENCQSFVVVDDCFMMTLRIPLPKMAIHLEEVFSIAQESGVCGIGESRRTLEPFANASQMVISMVGSIGLGEQVIGEQWFVRDVRQGWSWT